MKGWTLYVITVLLATIAAGLVWWFWQPLSDFSQSLHFPIPSSFALPSNSQVVTLDLWKPQGFIPETTDKDAPSISAQGAIVYDISTNRLLFAKQATKRLPMASLTKIMTAIVALEHPKLDDAYVVRPQSLVGNNVMGLSDGEVLTQRELLYGLILPSGNDAAETFADNYPEGREAFIAAMNQKVLSLGLSNTHFTNPSGLEGDGNQYTTAYDLLVMTYYALSHFPTFRDTVATVQIDLPATDTHREFNLFNETNLLTSYSGVKGVKDGYTPEAGLCLVTYLDYSGHQLVAVILGSDDRRGEMKELLDYSLTKIGIKPPAHG